MRLSYIESLIGIAKLCIELVRLLLREKVIHRLKKFQVTRTERQLARRL